MKKPFCTILKILILAAEKGKFSEVVVYKITDSFNVGPFTLYTGVGLVERRSNRTNSGLRGHFFWSRTI